MSTQKINKENSKILYLIHDFFFILLGVTLYAIGWTGFVLPQEVATGGLAGITTIIQIATGIPVTIPYNVTNVFLLLISIVFLGWRFSLKTVIGVALLGVAVPIGQAIFTDPSSEVYQKLWPWLTDIVPNIGPLLLGEKFLAVIIGGILCGAGLFSVFNVNGSTGGTDIIVALFNKYKNISLGRALVMIDALIITTSYFVNVYVVGKDPQLGIELLTFSAVEILFCSMTLDYLSNSNNQSVQLFIFSNHYRDINDAIIERLNRTCTIIQAEGGYSKKEARILMVVARKRELQAINRIIKEKDPKAFVSQGTVHGVYGEGFDVMR